jgi:hypothetical protein
MTLFQAQSTLGVSADSRRPHANDPIVAPEQTISTMTTKICAPPLQEEWPLWWKFSLAAALFLVLILVISIGWLFYAGVGGGRSQTFIHPIGAVVMTTRGVVSSYHSGIGSSQEGIRGAVEAAASQTVAPRASPALLLCFDFDSTTGRYTFAIMKFLQIGAAGMTLALAAMIYREFRKGARA